MVRLMRIFRSFVEHKEGTDFGMSALEYAKFQPCYICQAQIRGSTPSLFFHI